MKVVTPSREEILAIQARDGAFYFSACVAVVLRKHGVRAGAASPLLILRESPWLDEFDNVPSMVEGCVSADVLRRLDLTAERYKAEALELFDANDRRLGCLTYGKALVRRIPGSVEERSEPYLYRSSDSRWNVTAFEYQTFGRGPGVPVLFARRVNGSKQVVGVRVGQSVVLGIPLWDVVVQHHTSPPYDAGYYAMSVTSEDLGDMERWGLQQLATVGEVSVDPVWPRGQRAALTIRHDYDRQVRPSKLRALLRFYKQRGIRSTWFWRLMHLRNGQAKKVNKSGHEIALHTECSTEEGFVDEMREFTRELGFRPRGYSAHGGVPAVGHLGLRQIEWAIGADMLYGEALGLPIGTPCQAIRIIDDIPSPTSLVIPAVHRSLDLSTAPDGHCYETLLPEVRRGLDRGEHVVIMNHPDIHAEVLRELLNQIEYDGIWLATLGDVAEWFRRERIERKHLMRD